MNLKSQVSKAITNLKHWLEKIESRFNNQEASIEQNYFYEDLAPIDSADETNTYVQALNWALKNKKVTNIALTGPYGSGKSSILKTFETKYSEYKCLNISLATFKDDDQSDSKRIRPTPTKDENHRLIELSILQQMFYRETEHTIPNSRFKRISELQEKVLWYRTLITSIWLWGLALLLKSDSAPHFKWWPEFYTKYNDWILFFGACLMIPGTLSVLQLLIRKLDTVNFAKLNLKNGEIEFNPKSETSILNKHLDEILYFFQVTKYDVVVIEDLDRFNDPEIFTKLRELNYLLNYSLQVGRRIVFLYAIKDDMFIDESRTKFFDFIIPVIPVINSNNSLEMMTTRLHSFSVEEEFSKSFLNDVTLYIDDMRALKNIINEFIIYKTLLTGIAIKPDKLLALIIYKNINPSDFAQLHHNKGVLYDLFDSKTTIIANVTSRLENNKATLQGRIDRTDGSIFKNIRELRAVYIEAMIGKFSNFSHFNLSGDQITIDQIKEDENFEKIRKSTDLQYFYYNPSYGRYEQRNSGIPFKQIEEQIDQSASYLEREQTIKDKSQSATNDLNAEISEITKKINEIHLMTLKELFDFHPSIKDNLPAIATKNKLLMFLIQDGWIDESYPAIISYFYEGSVSTRDMNFIMSVKDREPLPFDYMLDKLSGVLERLKSDDFKRTSVFNYALIDYLFTISDKESKTKQNWIINQLKENSSKAIDFLLKYISIGKQTGSFVKQLVKIWPEFWDSLLSNPKIQPQHKAFFATLLIVDADYADIKKLNTSKKFELFLEGRGDFLEWFKDAELTKVKELISKLDLHFEQLRYDSKHRDLFEYIYKNKLFAVNNHMIYEIFKYNGASEETLQKLNTENYTTILESDFTTLFEAVENDIETYVSNVIIDNPDNREEGEKALIMLLNNDVISDLINPLIDHLSTKITDIITVREDVWVSLFEIGKVAPTWSNVLNYYKLKNKIDDDLIKFLNVKDNYTTLAKTRYTNDKKFEDTFYYQFSKDLLNSAISDESFSAFMENYPYYYDHPNSLSLKSYSRRKIVAMIENRKLRLGTSVYELIKENFSSSHVLLIEKGVKEFFDKRASYELDNEDFLNLLKSTNLTDKQKIILIEEIDAATIDKVAGLATQIATILSAHSYNSLPFEKLISILNNSKSAQANINLFYIHLNSLSKSQITEALNALGEPYSNITKAKKQPTLPHNQLNFKIGEILVAKGYIYKAKLDKGKLRFYNK
ncbi:MAG: hypothetical protein V4619_14095 [Bacteroidota bacterium]